ncbi:hypothetical protein [Sphingomonas sp. 22176]|uniref:hypothetical protein n=1 Tax=Sphingomonas sp. 22176 TaxID=3453884 RepID=UPI003F86B4FD
MKRFLNVSISSLTIVFGSLSASSTPAIADPIDWDAYQSCVLSCYDAFPGRERDCDLSCQRAFGLDTGEDGGGDGAGHLPDYSTWSPGRNCYGSFSAAFCSPA